MEEILPNQNQKNNHVISSQIELSNAGEAGSKAKPCKLLLKQDPEAAGRVLAKGQFPKDFSPLKGGRAERGAGGGSRPRSGESEGQGPAVLLEEEQVAGVLRHSDSELIPLSEGKSTKNKSASIVACEAGKWAIVYGLKTNADKIYVNRFRCKSWRCSYCSSQVRRKDYSRMQRAFKRNPGQYIFAVLTFDPKKIGKKNAYKSISKFSNALIKKIERAYGKIVGVQAVEQHKNGYPHVNFVFKFQDIHGIDKEFVNSFLKRFLTPEAVKCGFGRITSANLVIEGEMGKVLSYVSKTGLSIISGETNKDSQVPMEAPKGFRRLRSIRDFLKEAKRESEYTGGIVKSPIEEINSSLEAMGDKAMIENVSREFPAFVNAESVAIIKTEAEKVTNFFKYKHRSKTDRPYVIDYQTGEIFESGEIKYLTPESKISDYCLEQRESG